MNLASIVVALVVAVVLAVAVISVVKKKKQGKSLCSCGGSCSGCAMRGSCEHN